MREGYAEYLAIRERLNLPLLETGAVVVAWSEGDLPRLEEIEAQARANGVADVRRLSRAELLDREPHLATGCLGALLVPGEHVIDPWSAPLAYLRQAVEHGAVVRFDSEVLGGELARGLLDAAHQHRAGRGADRGQLRRPVRRRGRGAAPGRHRDDHPAAQGAVRRVRQGGGKAAAHHHPAGAERAHQGRRPGADDLRQPPGRPDRRGAGRPRTRHRRARRAGGLDRPGGRHGAGARGHAGHRRPMPACGRRPSARNTGCGTSPSGTGSRSAASAPPG